MREKLTFTARAKTGGRITPACAGKTQKRQPRRPTLRDHPRVCGKNRAAYVLHFRFLGSPPRVREKHENSYSLYHTLGITPACAGKTTRYHQQAMPVRDHPRVCGKNFNIVFHTLNNIGSPPRVREKPKLEQCSEKIPGITPACAGKTHKIPCLKLR